MRTKISLQLYCDIFVASKKNSTVFLFLFQTYINIVSFARIRKITLYNSTDLALPITPVVCTQFLITYQLFYFYSLADVLFYNGYCICNSVEIKQLISCQQVTATDEGNRQRYICRTVVPSSVCTLFFS